MSMKSLAQGRITSIADFLISIFIMAGIGFSVN